MQKKREGGRERQLNRERDGEGRYLIILDNAYCISFSTARTHNEIHWQKYDVNSAMKIKRAYEFGIKGRMDSCHEGGKPVQKRHHSIHSKRIEKCEKA